MRTVHKTRTSLVTVAAIAALVSVPLPAQALDAAPGASIAGLVSISQGEGTDAVIEVSAFDDTGDRVGSTIATAEGAFTIAELGAGAYRLQFDSTSERFDVVSPYWAGADDLVSSPEIVLEPSQQLVLPGQVIIPAEEKLRVPGAEGSASSDPPAIASMVSGWGSVSGVVTGNTGGSISNLSAQIQFFDLNGNLARSEPIPSSFGIQVPAGQFYIYFSAGPYPTDWAGEWYSNSYFGHGAQLVTIPENGSVTGINVELAAGSSISGTVTYPEAAIAGPAHQGYVWAYLYDGTTDDYELQNLAAVMSDGTYKVDSLPAGDYVLDFSDEAAGTLYDPIYWHDAVDFEDATLVTVGANQDLAGFNQTLPLKPLPAASYVKAVYQDVLGRAPDSAGLAYWTGRLVAGTPRQAVSAGFFTSDEFYLKKIREAYQDVLGRGADAGGEQYWLTQMRRGAVQADDAHRTFLLSDEFYFRNGEGYGYIQALYHDILGRSASIEEQQYWFGRAMELQGGRFVFNRGLVVNALWFSDEAFNVTVSNAYASLLGRAPDPGGLAYWAGYSKKYGVTAMRNQLTYSDEYFALASARFP